MKAIGPLPSRYLPDNSLLIRIGRGLTSVKNHDVYRPYASTRWPSSPPPQCSGGRVEKGRIPNASGSWKKNLKTLRYVLWYEFAFVAPCYLIASPKTPPFCRPRAPRTPLTLIINQVMCQYSQQTRINNKNRLIQKS